MSIKNLGIIGGGQLGSLLADAAKKLNIQTTIYCDDIDAPAQNFCDNFIYGKYDDKNKIQEFIKVVDIITYEFENIPYETLNNINLIKPLFCILPTTWETFALLTPIHSATLVCFISIPTSCK